MNQRPTIRRAEAHEAQRLSEVAFLSKAYWGYSPEFMAACRRELTFTPAELRDNLFFVGEVDGKVVGFYGLTPHAPSDIELEALFVEPAYIGQGYGRALMDHAKSTAKSLGAAALIIQGDPHAAPFYRAAGGQQTGQKESGSIPGRYLPMFVIQLTSH
ncbi:MAG: GNAT family N-acetyltransferase [Anaerolineales bacterium]|nr:GNAT family N-acetyltransferase [Anaerolineales bacterium]